MIKAGQFSKASAVQVHPVRANMILLDICQLYIYTYKFNGGLGKMCYKFIFQSLNELWGERLCCKTFFYGYCKARNCLKFNNICFVGLKIAKMI
jgi:hypothetical protein